MLISPAYAQTGAPGGFDLIQFVPLVLIFAIFYFLLIRPQQKKMKDHREMLSKISRNDRIVTNGGLIGKVTRVDADKDELTVEISEGVKVKVRQSMIADVLAKTEPGTARASKGKGKGKDDDADDDADASAEEQAEEKKSA
jgi:preprotein translocase subunit YajC